MKRGDKFMHHESEAKIMAVADGYAMARIPGCMPFVVYLKDVVSRDESRDSEPYDENVRLPDD